MWGNQLDLVGSGPPSVFGITGPKTPLFEGLYNPGSPTTIMKRKTCITEICEIVSYCITSLINSMPCEKI